MRDALDELETCGSLFLQELGEPATNRLRAVVAEGITSATAGSVDLGGVRLDGVHAVTPTGRHFELQWSQLVAYCVVNESYTDVPDELSVCESGRLLRRYSRSRFLSYVIADTLVSDLAASPPHHYCLACQDHVVHVVALSPPRITVLTPNR